MQNRIIFARNLLHNRLIMFLVLLLSVGFDRPTKLHAQSGEFALKDGDRVVFYGDSITEQRLYTMFVEEFVLTRFPDRKVDFINAGVGGDKVSGGWAGPIDLRLERDVFDNHPTVLTIMLGMNDGYYRPWGDGIFSTYSEGYRHMVDSVHKRLPGTRMLLIQPSPHDDVTRDPDFTPDYNQTMIRFGRFVSQLAAETGAQSADLNQPVVDALTKAKSQNQALSPALIQDRVHPEGAVHWLMAESVLKAWNAPPMVADVSIDAGKGSTTRQVNAEITRIEKTKNGISWVELDHALPLPLSPDSDPLLGLVEQVSDLRSALDREVLQITGLQAGNYALQIDERRMAVYTAEQLAAGIDLGTVMTPMRQQSLLVAYETEKKNQIEAERFSFAWNAHSQQDRDAVAALEHGLDAAVAQQRRDCQPVPHRFALIRSAEAGTR
ncbi:MAG TPA: SGNH/GDSL hydrolase family protein [Dongiaceae bacterium]|nr:SGNH/GDSL hydrolase family protein [Dongiaceae bacterium]